MRWAWPLLYAAATLAIAGPLLAPGYVFALDHAMGPQGAAYYSRYLADNGDAIQNKGAYALLLLGLQAIMPAWAAQKLILFVPFFLAGWGAHALAARRVRAPAAVFAGLLYMLSPFAYVRGVAGQTGVLWAYALAPWFLLAWLRALDGNRRAFAAAALLAFATGVFQAHGLVLLALLVGLVALTRLLREPRAWKAQLGRPAMLAGAVLLLNAAWIVPVMMAPSTTLDRIGVADRDYFQTTASGMPSVGVAALTLQGFWRPGYEGPYDGHLWLLVVPAAVLLLSVQGFRARRDDSSRALALAGALGFLLAVGPASPATAPLWNAAWDHVPLVKGFRDSQKLLALLALAYADLGAAGVDDLLGRLRTPRLPRLAPVAAVALVLLLPVTTAAPLLDGYDGQLGVAQYPPEWQAAEDATRGCSGSMLALPWHLYMDQSWLPNADKRVTNPAKLYFSCPLVASDDVEAGGSAGKAGEPMDQYVAFWLHDMGLASGNPRGIRTMGNLLSAVDVQYVLLLKDSDWRAQERVLAQQRDLKPILNNSRVEVWQNLAPLAPLTRDAEVVPLASWADLAPLSENRSLAGLAFAPPGIDPGKGPHVLLTPSADAPPTGWTLAGHAPRWTSLGVSPVFDASGSASPERSATWSVALPLWVVSGLSLVVLAGLCLPIHARHATAEARAAR